MPLRHKQIPDVNEVAHCCDECSQLCGPALIQALVSEPWSLPALYLLVGNLASFFFIHWEKCFRTTEDYRLGIEKLTGRNVTRR